MSINLLADDSYEAGTFSGVAQYNCSLAVDTTTTNARSGNNSLKITSNSTTLDAGYIFPSFTVQEGRVYRLTAYARLGTGTGHSIRWSGTMLRPEDNGSTFITPQSAPVLNSTSYTKIQYDWKIPDRGPSYSGYESFTPRLTSTNMRVPGYEIFIDDVSCVDITESSSGTYLPSGGDLQAAITDNSATGREIILENGGTYTVTTSLTGTGKISIRTLGPTPATIKQNGQSFTTVDFGSSTPAVTQVLTESATANMTRGWKVASTTGISVGMLFEVVSNELWPYDPRDILMKSELHRVSKISGSYVYSEDTANSSFDLTTETVTLNFYTPTYVTMDNVNMEAVLPATAEETASYIGLRVRYGSKTRLTNVQVTNHAEAGINLVGCYESKVIGGRTEGANNYWTGYGVSVSGSAHTIVEDRDFHQCRRGVDVTGSVVISRVSRISGCTMIGGGYNSRNEPYGWDPITGALGAYQCAYGTHGGSDTIVYENNISKDLHCHYTTRGINEVIKNNTMVGRSRYGAIQLVFGANTVIMGNTLLSGVGAEKDSSTFQGVSAVNRRTDYFVSVKPDYSTTGNLTIKGNFAEVQNQFVNFTTAFPTWASITDNTAYFQYTDALAELAFLWNEETTARDMSFRWDVNNNNIKRISGTGPLKMFHNIEAAVPLRLVSPNGTAYKITISDGGVLAATAE